MAKPFLPATLLEMNSTTDNVLAILRLQCNFQQNLFEKVTLADTKKFLATHKTQEAHLGLWSNIYDGAFSRK